MAEGGSEEGGKVGAERPAVRLAARPIAGLLVVGLGVSLPTFDLAVNVAFPAITAAFALETRAIRWIVVFYVLTYASLMLAFGRLGDLAGYRRVFGAGLGVSALAFTLCGFAPDYEWLLAARVVQGVGAALVLSCAPALATSLYEESRRTRVLGAYATMAAAAAVAAPLLGGASIALAGWSGVFWFRLPIALAALALLPLLPRDARPHWRAYDLAGAALLAAGLALLLLAPALPQAGDSGWSALAAASLALALLVTFARRQSAAREPFALLAALRDRQFLLANLGNVAVFLAAFAVPLLAPYYLARIGGYGPFEIGLLLAAAPIGTMAGSTLAAPAARAIGRGRMAFLGGALLALGQFLIGWWTFEPGPAAIVGTLLLHGAGMGLFQVAYADIVLEALPLRERGVAGSLTMLTRTLGILVGVAALSAAQHLLEGARLAAGDPAPDAFLAAFQEVFRYSALLFGGSLVLGGMLAMRRGR